MADLTITRAQYDALIAAANDGDLAEVLRLKKLIDKANGVKRYQLYIRWQDVGGQPPPTIELGKGWPADQLYFLEQDRPIAREDVDQVLLINAANPVGTHVTLDPNGQVGWTILDDFDFNSAT